MQFILLLAGAVLARPQLSATDQKFMVRIHQATSKVSGRKSSLLRFNEQVTLRDAQRCRMFQSRVPKNSQAYIELSFVQAYYGLDYKTNLRRALRPYRLWSTNIGRWGKEYPQASSTEWTELESAPLILNLLYLRHHDLRSLGTWLDLRLDGGPAEVNDDALGELWVRHKREMILACDGHPDRIENLTRALMFHTVLNAGERSPYTRSKRQFAATLQPLVHSRDPRVSRTARALTRRVLNNHLWKY